VRGIVVRVWTEYLIKEKSTYKGDYPAGVQQRTKGGRGTESHKKGQNAGRSKKKIPSKPKGGQWKDSNRGVLRGTRGGPIWITSLFVLMGGKPAIRVVKRGSDRQRVSCQKDCERQVPKEFSRTAKTS